MITLENEIVASILEDMAKENVTITPSDIKTFFDRSNEKFVRLIETKELSLVHAKKRLAALSSVTEEIEFDSKSVVKVILSDLQGRLNVALSEFKDRKQTKHDGLIKQLKLAVIARRPSVILKCLYEIQMLSNALKDLRIVELQEQILKYSLMAEEDGKQYLNFYSRQEEQENLTVEIALLTNEIQALKSVVN